MKDKVIQADFTDISAAQIRQQEKVIDEFINYSQAKYKIDITREDAEAALISFLKKHDTDLLFAAQIGTVLPEVKIKEKYKFILCKFIEHSSVSEPEIFEFITNITIGHILASALLYTEFDKFAGKLRGTNLYFDTAFVFRLLGVDGNHRQTVYEDFIKILLDQDARLFVFDHTYEEIQQILENCLHWIGSPGYDPNKASPVLNYFIQNSYSESDIERVIVNLKTYLENRRIIIAKVPDPNELQQFQIDEEQLHTLIVETYREHTTIFAEWKKESTIIKDIRSISSIYKLRKGRRPHSINEAEHTFVTTNSTLALVSKKFDLPGSADAFTIPVCVTDIFLGTIIWLQSPPKMLEINQKRIIADCYAALRPSVTLIRKYSAEIEKLKNQNIISPNECYLLRTSRVARELLEEKTLGDPENFTDKTPEEILEDIKNKFKREGEKQYIEEIEHHEKTAKQLAIIGIQQDTTNRRIESFAEIISKICSGLVFVIFIPLISIGIIVTCSPDLLAQHPLIKNGIIAVIAIANLFNIVYGYYIKDFGGGIKKLVKAKIMRLFS